MNNLIEIKNLIKSYDNSNINVLKNINLIVNRGDFISIIGPSGSGKTTLLNIIGILDTFNNGQYFFNNIDAKNLHEKDKNIFRNRNIGFIHQYHYLIPELTTIENVILPMLIANYDYNESIKKAEILLNEFNLKDKINSKTKLLSGGEQQRVSIARAMINSPDLIIADEMTGNLDEENSNNIFEFFVEKASIKKQTIIFVTHNIKLAGKAKLKYKLENGILQKYN